MSVTQKLLLAESDTVDRTVYTTASITPGANKLILCMVNAVDQGYTAAIQVNSITGCNLTWVEVAEIQYDTIAGPKQTIAVYRALGPAPVPGALTITLDGPANVANWIITEFGNVDTGGTNGSAAVVQSATNVADSGTSLTATLAAFGAVGNATVGCYASAGASATLSPGSGFTEIAENSGVNVPSHMMEWRVDNDTSVDASASADADQAIVGLEIKAGPVEITSKVLLEQVDAVSRTVYTTNSIDPAANKLILCFLSSTDQGFAGPIVVNSITGAGLTWVEAAEIQFDTIASPRQFLTCYRALGASPSPGALTITLDGPAFACHWIIVEFDNVDTSGTNGSGAIVQVVTNVTDSGTKIAAPMAQLEDAANALVGGFESGESGVTDWAAGAGFTELDQSVFGTDRFMMVQFSGALNTEVDATADSTAKLAVIAFELRHATPAGYVPITQKLLLSVNDPADLTVYTTASISPSANKLILCQVMTADFGFSGPISVVSITGAGLTWVKVQEVQYDTIAGPRQAFAVFRALGPSPSPGALTITMDGPASQADYIITEFSDIDTGGSNGADAVVQNATNSVDSDTSIVGTLSAFQDVQNATVGCFSANGPATPFTIGNGFTLVSEIPGDISSLMQFRIDNDTTVDCSISGGASDIAVIALELRNATAAEPPAAPITAALLTSGQSESDTTVYSTASISPSADKILFALVHGLRLSVAPNNPPTCAGNGLTWVQVTTRNFAHGSGGGEFRTGFTIFRAIGSGPTTGAVSFTFPDTQARASFAVLEFDNADISGVDGENAVVQVVTGTQIDSPSTTPVANMAAFGDVLNATFGGSCWSVGDGGESVAPGSGFTELSENSNGSVGTGTQTQFRNDNDLTVDVVYSGLPITDFSAVAFGIEIKNASETPPPPPPPPSEGVSSFPVPPGPAYIVTNLITPNPTLVSSSSVDPVYGHANLSDGNVAKPMRWQENIGTIFVEFDFGQQISADTIVLLNHNFPVGSTFSLKTGPLAAPSTIRATPLWRRFDIYAKFADPLDRVWRLEITLGLGAPQPQLGLVFIANRIEMETHMTFGMARGIEHRKNTQQTQRGTRWVYDAYDRQVFEAIFRSLKQEHVDELNKLDRLVGGSRRPFVFVPDVNLPDVYFVKKIGDHRAESRR